ncbi:IclR family transcriptional regulator [Pseudomonas sp. NA-150]|uniref:IclR family transcriptional regulator n=1 Tax=Pseudomonas sp. NA-150 TaxID=3367525 RepID=UPI0037C87FB2
MAKNPTTATFDPEGPGVAAVNRALSILCVFRHDDDSLTLADVAARTGLYKSTILRLTESLETFGMLTRDTSGRFRLGVELVRLGAAAKLSVGGQADINVMLVDMTAATGESATYYVRRGSFRLALYRVDSPKSVRDHIRVGDLLSLEKGASGRVLSNTAPLDQRGNNPFETFVTIGERDPDVAAISGPVFCGDEIVGALALSGPISRFTEDNIAGMREILVKKCKQLSALLAPQ